MSLRLRAYGERAAGAEDELREGAGREIEAWVWEGMWVGWWEGGGVNEKDSLWEGVGGGEESGGRQGGEAGVMELSL